MRKLLCILLLISPFAYGADATWQSMADSVCKQIQNALLAYQKNDLKDAHLQATMAYFKGYDALLEPSVRTTLGGPHVFEIEQAFRNYTKLMTPNPDALQLKKVSNASDALCQSIKLDAKALLDAHVPLTDVKGKE